MAEPMATVTAEEFERFRSEVNGRFERLEKTVVDGTAALMAAILQLGRAR
ncbi:MAG: hypothetical protein SFW67_12680 [Myxococcaceae bacterium]|nr:hypothetical protein [Myxococcaceae bacterium]